MFGGGHFGHGTAMHSTLLILLVVAGAVLAIGAVIAVVALRNAPEGVETDEGFQFVRNDRSEPYGAVRVHADESAPIHPPGLGLAA